MTIKNASDSSVSYSKYAFSFVKTFCLFSSFIFLLIAFFFPEYEIKKISLIDIVTVIFGFVVVIDFYLRSSFNFKIIDIYILVFLFVSAVVIALNNNFFDFLLAIRCIQAVVVYLFFRSYFNELRTSLFIQLSILLLSIIDFSLFINQIYFGYKGFYGYSLLGFYYPLQQLYFTLLMLFFLISFVSYAAIKNKFYMFLLYSSICFYFMSLLFVGSKMGWLYFLFIGLYTLSRFKEKKWFLVLICFILSIVLYAIVRFSPLYKIYNVEISPIEISPIEISPIEISPIELSPNSTSVTDIVEHQPSSLPVREFNLDLPSSFENFISIFERFKLKTIIESVHSRYSDRPGKACSVMGNGTLNYDSEILLRYCKGGVGFSLISTAAIVFLLLIVAVPIYLSMPIIIALFFHEVLFVGISNFVLLCCLGSFLSQKFAKEKND